LDFLLLILYATDTEQAAALTIVVTGNATAANGPIFDGDAAIPVLTLGRTPPTTVTADTLETTATIELYIATRQGGKSVIVLSSFFKVLSQFSPKVLGMFWQKRTL